MSCCRKVTNMKKLILFSFLFCLAACHSHSKQAEHPTAVDEALQAKVARVLTERLSIVGASSGIIVVMNTQTGELEAVLGLNRLKNGMYASCKNYAQPEESVLIRPVSLLAALSTGNVNIDDLFDRSGGTYTAFGVQINDRDLQASSSCTLADGVAAGSDVVLYKAVEKAFSNQPQNYFDMLEKMYFGMPNRVDGIPEMKSARLCTPRVAKWRPAIFVRTICGYNQQLTPIQMLTFYNAMAGDGLMVCPQIYKDTTDVIMPQIAKTDYINAVKKVFAKMMSAAQVDVHSLTGYYGSTQLSDAKSKLPTIAFREEFCGFTPSVNPNYSIFVSIETKGQPANSRLALEVAKQVVKCLDVNSARRR